MFRSRNTSRPTQGPEPVPVPVATQHRLPLEGKSARKYNWRPSLRRIRQYVFSSNDAMLSPQNQLPQETSSTKSKKFIQLKFIKPSQTPTGAPQARPRYIEAKIPAPSPERPKTSREKSSNGIDITPRTLTKRGHSTSELRVLNQSATKEKGERGPLLPPHLQDYSGTSAYVPKHAASDFRHNTKERKSEPEAEWAKTAVYVPKHAASDFYKMTMTMSTFASVVAQHQVSTEPSDPVIQSRPPEREENNDFQIFLREARIAAAQSYNSYRVISPNKLNSQTSHVMDNIINTNRTNELHKAMSISQRTHRTSASRASKRGSVIDMVQEYINPSRPKSIYLAPPSISDKRSSRGSEYFAQADWDHEDTSRWSRMGGSIRRSFSRDRDQEEDDSAKALKDLRRRTEKRRSYVMPTSTGLLNYNKAVLAEKYFT